MRSLVISWSLIVVPLLIAFIAAPKLTSQLDDRRRLFDDHFKGKIPDSARAEICEIRKDAVSWKIGLFSLDSSNHSDWFARGVVTEDKFKGLADAARGDFDLCIVLVHHHLQSVRRLEERRKENPAS